MSSPRANANQSLYLGKILLQGWGWALEAQEVPALTLGAAYLPAVREHLVQSYGWFLLEIAGVDDHASSLLPRNCAELPALAEGKALSGELREFQQLEARGWLAEMLTPEISSPVPARSAGNLATAGQQSDCADASDWARRLETLYGRMRDSLEEC